MQCTRSRGGSDEEHLARSDKHTRGVNEVYLIDYEKQNEGLPVPGGK